MFVPPRVVRNYENISDEVGDMLVVTAGAEDTTELVYTREVKADITDRAGAQVPQMIQKLGLQFM